MEELKKKELSRKKIIWTSFIVISIIFTLCWWTALTIYAKEKIKEEDKETRAVIQRII